MKTVLAGWASSRLGEVARVIHGWPFKSAHFAVGDESLPVVVAIGNFDYSGGFRFSTSAVKRYGGEYPAEYRLNPGDILLVMTCQTEGGEILGVPGIVPDDGQTYLHNQRLGRIEITHQDRIDAGYLYHWARSAAFNDQLFVTSSGSKILHTSPSRIEQTLISLPPLAEQKAISRVLGSLDDKIAANGRVAAAVDEYLGTKFQIELSRGFEPGTLDMLADVNTEAARPVEGGTLRYIDIASVGVGSHEYPSEISWSDAPGRARRKVKRGDILWSTVRPNRRSHTLNLSGDRQIVASTGLAVISPREAGFAYVYEATRTVAFSRYLENVAEGSAYPAVRAERFNSAPVPLISQTRRTEFEAVATPVREHLEHLREENRALVNMRDAMLPALMSGDLRAQVGFGEI